MEYTIKCVICGQSGSGKTAIIKRYLEDKFIPTNTYTVGVDFFYKKIDINNIKYKLHIWDTCGLIHYRSLIQLYYKQANIILYVFTINDLDSEKECLECITNTQFPPTTRKYIIGNKTDLLSDKYDFTKSILYNQCSTNNIRLFECSAKTGYNVNTIFDTIVDEYKAEYNNNTIQIGINTMPKLSFFKRC